MQTTSKPTLWNLFQRAAAYEPLTPGERAFLTGFWQIVINILAVALTTGYNLLASHQAINWGQILMLAALNIVGTAARHYATTSNDPLIDSAENNQPALGGNPPPVEIPPSNNVTGSPPEQTGS